MIWLKQFSKLTVHHPSNQVRHFNTSPSMYSIKWRLENGFPKYWRERGVLTDGPDFSYIDGRPSPYSSGQRKRLLEQKTYAEKVIHLLDVIRYSKQQYQDKLQKQKEDQQIVLSKKLTWKGIKPAPTEPFETRKNRLRWSYTRKLDMNYLKKPNRHMVALEHK